MRIPKINSIPKYNRPLKQKKSVSQPKAKETKSKELLQKYKNLRNINMQNMNSKQIVILCTTIGLASPIPFGFAAGCLAGIFIAAYKKFTRK